MIIDLTGVSCAAIAGICGILGPIVLYQIQARMKDKAAATALSAAITNSIGAGQQAAIGIVTALHPTVTIPGVPSTLQVQTQYVLDHAGDEMKRFGIDPVAIADKINAKQGLIAIAAAVPSAVAALPDGITIPTRPLAPWSAPPATA